ncbi:MAG: hypothetical protein WDO19_26040 [Bacteroidota bacterium]
MKRILFSAIGIIAISHLFGQQDKPVEKKDSFLLLEPVEVTAVRASEKAPFTKTNLFKKKLKRSILGRTCHLS